MLLSGGDSAVGLPHCILVIIVLHPILTQSQVGEAARPDHVWIRRWGYKTVSFLYRSKPTKREFCYIQTNLLFPVYL